MVQIAITGGIACGKSLVGEFLRARQVRVWDADGVVHALLRSGEPVFDDVVAAFGRGVVAQGGVEIDRRALGEIVFADPVARDRLNALVHPVVRQRLVAWRLQMSGAGAGIAAALVPLLFEAGLASGWEAIACVVASLATQRARLKLRGFDDEAADRRIRAQMSNTEKAKRSDYVIVNDGTKVLTEEQTKRMLECIMERPYGG